MLTASLRQLRLVLKGNDELVKRVQIFDFRGRRVQGKHDLLYRLRRQSLLCRTQSCETSFRLLHLRQYLLLQRKRRNLVRTPNSSHALE